MIDDKIKGLIFGQAIGDALGLSTEFLTKRQVDNIYKERITYDNIFQDDYRKTWKKGEWTDDTDMFLILFNHLLNSENFLVDELILAKDFHNWYNKGFEIQDNVYKKAKGIGINIGRVLKDEGFLSNPKLSSFKISLHSKSNGSVMRSGILSIFPNEIFNTIESCKITHMSDDCIVSCLFLVLFLKKLQHCADYEDIIENVLNVIELNYDVDILRKIINIKNLSELDLNNNIGYTYKPIGCAIYALKNLKDKSFYDALEEIIKEGGDGDTNGCVTGCILGCYMGFDNIDKWLIESLENKNYLFNIFYLYKMKIHEDEIDDHSNFIVDCNMQDIVYEYTKSSSKLRKEFNQIEKLNQLILYAPKLNKKYTVYNMKSSDDKILYIDVNNRQTRFIDAWELKKGDVFSQQSNYDYNVISTTYDKNYPLISFSKDLKNEFDIDVIGMYTFADVYKFSKFNVQIEHIYFELFEYIKTYSIFRSETFEDITIEDIEYELKDKNIYNPEQCEEIGKLIKKLKKTIAKRYYLDLCCCCLFRIKITNKTGLMIEKCSQYPDQKEILLPDPTFFIVKNISREQYKIIDPFDYYNTTQNFSINGKKYQKYNKMPEIEKNDFDTKIGTVYDVEIIDMSKYKDKEKSWFKSYNDVPNLFNNHSEPIVYHSQHLENLFSHMSSKKSPKKSRKSLK